MTQATTTSDAGLRSRVEDFLFTEALLLDEWRLDEWLGLFTNDAVYEVPATDFTSGDGTNSLMLISDDRTRIGARVIRLQSRRAHREFPSSRTRHMVTNVRAEQIDDYIAVTAYFCVYRIHRGVFPYIGQYRYRLVSNGDCFLIAAKRVELDLESLRPHGTVSILL